MNLINQDISCFLIIDVQEKLVKMINDDNIKKNAVILAKTAGIMNIPVIITEQYPKGLGSTIPEISNELTNVQYFEKTKFSAFDDIILPDKKQIIIYGIETHICVLQTAFDLLNREYEVFLVSDACGSRTSQNKEIALQRLIQSGAEIVTTEMVLFELLKSSKHPNFKEVQSLVK